MRGVSLKLGWVVASIVSTSLIVGRASPACSPTLIVYGGGPGMLNLMVSAPVFALAALIASRSVQFAALHTPSSVSAVELTTKVCDDTVVVIAGAVCPFCRKTRSVNESALRRIGSAATGRLDASR